jgi:hypothetical protein
MRDNSEFPSLTKVNTQHGFQPIYTFIMRSGHAMIYDILNNLSQSARELWQFWNAEGFEFMTPALLNPDRGSFFNDSENEALETATGEEKVLVKRRTITYSEILTYALPTSSKVAEFNSLIDRVSTSQKQTSFVKRDDSATAEAMILLSDILIEDWDRFPLKAKILLLDKLRVYRKSFWQHILNSPSDFFKLIKIRISYYLKFFSELRTYDANTRRNILSKISRDVKLLKNSWDVLGKTRLIILEKDSYLLEENKDNIDRFIHSAKTMIAARYLMTKYSKVLEELAK